MNRNSSRGFGASLGAKTRLSPRPSTRSTTTRTRADAHVLVIGTGVAGLSSALSALAAGADVTLVCEGARLAEFGGNTQLAQGGIAAAIGIGDTPSKHAQDTVAAGAGLVDPLAAQALTTAGARAVRALIEAGFPVDRDSSGAPVLGMEGAHGEHRIVHAGEDRTGAVLHQFLHDQVQREVDGGRITLLTSRTATELLVRDGAIVGAALRDASGTLSTHTAGAVVLATGGYAGLYPRSTNAPGVRGDGVLLAARAGALLTDLEFVQFHPTVIHGTGSLISEAVRGAGAVLRDGSGRNFMRDAHPLGDLAPRDVVSREIHRALRERGEASVWLDATGIERSSPGSLSRRFPAITAAASAHGHDWARDPIPVSPAAHYSMGGVWTDQAARTSEPGLFAAGEVAATGVHGANRLASNSLLEGLVFGRRAGDAAAAFAHSGPESAEFADAGSAGAPSVWAPAAISQLEQEALVVALPGADIAGSTTSVASNTSVAASIDSGLGIVRCAEDFARAAQVFSAHSSGAAQLASLILAAADARTESRGAHQRSDYPDTDPAQAVRRGVRAVCAVSDYSASLDGTASGLTVHAMTSHATTDQAMTSQATPLPRVKEPHPC